MIKATEKPNIILIMTDQQRFDSIAALGATWMHTPNLDHLVGEGVSFVNCFVNSPVCVASRASLFAGKYPYKTGVFHNFHWLFEVFFWPTTTPGGEHKKILLQ